MTNIVKYTKEFTIRVEDQGVAFLQILLDKVGQSWIHQRICPVLCQIFTFLSAVIFEKIMEISKRCHFSHVKIRKSAYYEKLVKRKKRESKWLKLLISTVFAVILLPA